jgi:3-oxoacyl-[acyl-carrier protein] reductase
MRNHEEREERPPVTDQFSRTGRTAMATESSPGLGKAIAMSLGAAGARVALNDANDQTRAETAFAESAAAGYEGDLVGGSVMEETDVDRINRINRIDRINRIVMIEMIEMIVTEVERRLGRIDILVVNATPNQPHMPIKEDEWAFNPSTLDVFIKSPFLLARAVLSHMTAQRWGRIIHIDSEAVTLGQGNFNADVAAKGGQNGWNRLTATELAPFNITVNMVSPGWIAVERHETDPQEEKDAYRSGVPMGRPCRRQRCSRLDHRSASAGEWWIRRRLMARWQKTQEHHRGSGEGRTRRSGCRNSLRRPSKLRWRLR